MAHPRTTADGLDPIERASRDEIQALQLSRLRWTIQHAYDNVPHYRAKLYAANVHPSCVTRSSPALLRREPQMTSSP